MIDITDTVVPKDIEEHIEEIAENVHNEWTRDHTDKGWRYGEVCDKEKKTTPCLLPYLDLPETEKEYDRVTARAAIKSIIALKEREKNPR